jgi:fructokinase
LHFKKTINSVGRPLIFGEVLYDLFPEGNKVLGGAPFNVAWHLQGLGLPPLLISRIGNDQLGYNALEQMKKWGMDISGIQLDQEQSTGVVRVLSEKDSPRFEIPSLQAYDYIEKSSALRNTKKINLSLIYHGTLACRHSVSDSTLKSLMKKLNLPIFIDVNLRSPWWEKSLIYSFLQQACWIKMNEEELFLLSNIPKSSGLKKAGKVLLQNRKNKSLIVTRGSRGAFFLLPGNKKIDSPGMEATGVVDTVGAGDAFSAVLILGIALNWNVLITLERSLEFASTIVRQRGATRQDPELYQFFKKKWKL